VKWGEQVRKIHDAQQKTSVHTEMSGQGNIRIVAHGKAGEWVTYEGIATLKTDTELLIAVTDYFSGDLEGEVVYRVVPAGFTTEELRRLYSG